MLLMLATPILLFTIAHVLFPSNKDCTDLGDYYFSRARLIWSLGLVTVITGVGFRPLAFGMPLLIADNLSAIPSVLLCILLLTIRNRTVHKFIVPLIPIMIALDTLAINYLIR